MKFFFLLIGLVGATKIFDEDYHTVIDHVKIAGEVNVSRNYKLTFVQKLPMGPSH